MYLPQALSPSDSPAVESRQLGGGNYRYNTTRTRWSSWGRWVLAGILLFMGLVLVFIVLCISRRRQRKRQLAAGTNAPMVNMNPGYSQQPQQGGPPLYNQNQGGYGGDVGYKPYGQDNNAGGFNNGAAADYYGQTQQQQQQYTGVTQPQGAHYR